MKVEINSFFIGIWVELVMLYTHDYALFAHQESVIRKFNNC